MKKSFALALSIVPLLLSTAALADEWTITQPITHTVYNGGSDLLFFTSDAKWGAPSCPNATYVKIPNTVTGKDKLLAIGMMAHASGKTVSFLGTCDSDPAYFNAYYIIVN